MAAPDGSDTTPRITPVVACDCANRDDTVTASSSSTALSTAGRRRSGPRVTCLMGVGLRWQLSRAQKIGTGLAAGATMDRPLHSRPRSLRSRTMSHRPTALLFALACALACAPRAAAGPALGTVTASAYA